MDNIDDKFNEAKYFYKKMTESDLPLDFNKNLSAFLSASRSVLLYVLEDAKKQNGGQSWYDNKIKNSNYAKYFKDKRDTNIHSNAIDIDTGLLINHQTENPTLKIVHYFKDWNNPSDDVLFLCDNCLKEIENILQDGIVKKILYY